MIFFSIYLYQITLIKNFVLFTNSFKLFLSCKLVNPIRLSVGLKEGFLNKTTLISPHPDCSIKINKRSLLFPLNRKQKYLLCLPTDKNNFTNRNQSGTPVTIGLFKFINGNIRTIYKICSKLTIKTP